MVQENQLIALPELKKYLNWAEGDTAIDDFLNDMINAASDVLEQYCNTKIKKSEVTEVVSGDGSIKLYLSNRPITEIKTLKYFDGEKFADFMSDAEIRKNIVTMDHSIYNRAEVFEEGIMNYEVKYMCGFDPVPQDLKLICQELCAIFYKNSFIGEGRVGLISNQQGNFKMFCLEQLPFHKKVIDKYRLINI